MEAIKQPQFTGIVWLFARLWLGYEWLMAGYEKMFGPGSAAWVGAKAGSAVADLLKGAIAKSPLAPDFDAAANAHPAVQEWYASLAQKVFLPNAVAFSYLVAFGEIAVGIALIVALFTHFAALMGVVMNLAYLFAGTTSTNPQMLVVGLAIVLAGGVAVGFYGLDYFARPIERQLMERIRPQVAQPTPA